MGGDWRGGGSLRVLSSPKLAHRQPNQTEGTGWISPWARIQGHSRAAGGCWGPPPCEGSDPERRPTAGGSGPRRLLGDHAEPGAPCGASGPSPRPRLGGDPEVKRPSQWEWAGRRKGRLLVERRKPDSQTRESGRQSFHRDPHQAGWFEAGQFTHPKMFNLDSTTGWTEDPPKDMLGDRSEHMARSMVSFRAPKRRVYTSRGGGSRTCPLGPMLRWALEVFALSGCVNHGDGQRQGLCPRLGFPKICALI